MRLLILFNKENKEYDSSMNVKCWSKLKFIIWKN